MSDACACVDTALETEGVLEHMRQHSIETVFLYSVDNLLVRVADPLFIGYFLDKVPYRSNEARTLRCDSDRTLTLFLWAGIRLRRQSSVEARRDREGRRAVPAQWSSISGRVQVCAFVGHTRERGI